MERPHRHDTNNEFETIGQAARRLLEELDARVATRGANDNHAASLAVAMRRRNSASALERVAPVANAPVSGSRAVQVPSQVQVMTKDALMTAPRR